MDKPANGLSTASNWLWNFFVVCGLCVVGYAETDFSR